VALGQCLLQAGKERFTATGLLAYAGNLDNPVQVEIIWQYSLKVRLTQGDSSQAFDMSNTSLKAPVSPIMAKTMEAL
jgi:hypothetical protein